MAEEDIAPLEAGAAYQSLELPRRALKALSGLEGLAAGPLSPLGRLEAPAGAADAGALASAWEKLGGAWEWAVPALFDPHRTVALVMGDGNTNLVGQYLFPDAAALGPGFHLSVGGEALTLAGPLSLWFLGAGLYSRLALEDVMEVEPFRIELSAGHFWALMACLDAYRAVALARRLRRLGGGPAGVGLEDAAKAWSDGVSFPNPGWAVSLFSLLVPDLVPRDLEQGLPRLLAEMARQGHLQAAGESGEVLYALPEALSPLLWGPTTALSFGLVSQRLAGPGGAEVTILGGWRTLGGVWIADLSELGLGKAALALLGPTLATAVIDNVIGEDTPAMSWEGFAMDTPFARDALVSRLREMEAAGKAAAAATGAPEEAAPATPGFCARCGHELREGARFCRGCGAEVPGAEAGAAAPAAVYRRCPWCGSKVAEELAFCNRCGKPLREAELQARFCPGCGSRLREGARFCRGCGMKL
ncbi:MAG: zinc ribbon domain-containing protein [Actinomycetota bacterium]|nr:zinc ribbon domain-containing protein [Actinomycetota bacterium]